jgi:hypothetical protein
MHVVFKGSSEWMRGPTNFPKTLMPYEKPRCQNRDIKGVHNLKVRHFLGVVVHMASKNLGYICHLTQSCKWLSLLGTLQRHSPDVYWRLYKLKSRTIIMETNTIKCARICCISNVHITACLARRYIPRAWMQVKMTFIHAPRKVNYI